MNVKGALIAATGVALVFLWALYGLLALEYQSGENLPEYSTLRKDPRGASAFYEALDALPEVGATRNRLPLRQWEPNTKGVLFLAGAVEELQVDHAAINRLEGFVAGGGRLVIAFTGSGSFRAAVRAADTPEDEAGSEDQEEQDTEAAEEETQDAQFQQEPNEPENRLDELQSSVPLHERWGFDYSRDRTGVTLGDERGYLVQSRIDGSAGLPEILRWRGALAFKQWHEPWRVVYSRGPDRAAVLERRFGQGTIVLASDSYILSNEALRHDRQTAFLTWLVGRHPRVTFDESHLGLAPRVGVMTLARRYGLAPVLAVFAVVFALFLWCNASSLLPRHAANQEAAELHVEKGASAALASLLQRSTDPKHLLRTCVETWSHTAKWQGRHAAAARGEVAAVFEQLERESQGRPDPVAGYKRIRAVLEERKPKP